MSDEESNVTGDEDAEWGFKKRKRRMSRESKIGLSLVLILLIAFGVVVYDKLNPDQTLMSLLKGDTSTDNENAVTIPPPKSESKPGSEDDKTDSDPFANDEFTKVATNEQDNPTEPSVDELFFPNTNLNTAVGSQDNEKQQPQRDDSDARQLFTSFENGGSGIEEPNGTVQSDARNLQGPAERNTITSRGASDIESDPFGQTDSTLDLPANNVAQSAQQPASSILELDGHETANTAGAAGPARQTSLFPDDAPLSSGQTEPAKPSPSVDDDSFFPRDASTIETARQPPPVRGVGQTMTNPEAIDENTEPDTSITTTDSSFGISPQQDAFSPPVTVAQTENESKFFQGATRQTADPADEFGLDEGKSEPLFADDSDSNEDSEFGGYQSVDISDERAGSSTVVSRPARGNTPSPNGGLKDNDNLWNDQRDGSFGEPDIAVSFNEQSVPSPDPGFGNPNNVRRETAPAGEFDRPTTSRRMESAGSVAAESSVTPKSDGTSIPPFSPTSPITSAGDREYVVQPGDNYWKISKKQYGTIRYFQALAKFNQSRNSDPRRLRPGLKLMTPSRETLEKLIPQPAPKTTVAVSQFADNSKSRMTSGTSRAGLAGKTYVIQSGDNFWTISKKLYGSVAYFQALTAYNQRLGIDPRRLRPGTQIAAPSRATLQARYAKLIPKATSATAASAGQQQAGFFMSRDGTPMYRIGGRETLSGISKTHLGRSSRWVQIYQLNKSQLSNPDSLTIGTVLRLPVDASSVRLAESPREIR